MAPYFFEALRVRMACLAVRAHEIKKYEAKHHVLRSPRIVSGRQHM